MFRLSAAFVIILMVHFPAFAESSLPPTTKCALSNDVPYCLAQKKQFLAAWPKANAGDYQSQRTVAFCLLNGCYGAVKIDPKEACIWATVIVSTDKSDASDVSNYRQSCRLVSMDDRASTTGAAMMSYTRIYKKLMTKALPYEPPSRTLNN